MNISDNFYSIAVVPNDQPKETGASNGSKLYDHDGFGPGVDIINNPPEVNIPIVYEA